MKKKTKKEVPATIHLMQITGQAFGINPDSLLGLYSYIHSGKKKTKKQKGG